MRKGRPVVPPVACMRMSRSSGAPWLLPRGGCASCASWNSRFSVKGKRARSRAWRMARGSTPAPSYLPARRPGTVGRGSSRAIRRGLPAPRGPAQVEVPRPLIELPPVDGDLGIDVDVVKGLQCLGAHDNGSDGTLNRERLRAL